MNTFVGIFSASREDLATLTEDRLKLFFRQSVEFVSLSDATLFRTMYSDKHTKIAYQVNGTSLVVSLQSKQFGILNKKYVCVSLVVYKLHSIC